VIKADKDFWLRVVEAYGSCRESKNWGGFYTVFPYDIVLTSLEDFVEFMSIMRVNFNLSKGLNRIIRSRFNIPIPPAEVLKRIKLGFRYLLRSKPLLSSMKKITIVFTDVPENYNVFNRRYGLYKSKSEWIITLTLQAANIPFVYKPTTKITGLGNYHPDFYFKGNDGAVVVWEHWGLNSEHYCVNKERKLALYRNKGFIVVESFERDSFYHQVQSNVGLLKSLLNN